MTPMTLLSKFNEQVNALLCKAHLISAYPYLIFEFSCLTYWCGTYIYKY